MADKKAASLSKALVSGEGVADDRLFRRDLLAKFKAGHEVISLSFNLEITHGCEAETHCRRRVVFFNANRIRGALNGQADRVVGRYSSSLESIR
ncbi:hypothetical protein [Rhizobium bangladeshense]|uniref:hypothetical protein n=1 Tax=Rhizobium bangladeshense TaxID=1138189 RepID=UPI0018D44442|nr:hypothetical protein [Rhizobium bangladeshense]